MQKKYELYDIKPNKDKLRSFRKCYIDVLDKPLIYKVTSTHPICWQYNQGFYDFNEKLNGGFYEFALAPLRKQSNLIVDSFINHGSENGENAKAFKIGGEEIFLYSKSTDFYKYGKRYRLEPALLISEDIYNLIKIQYRDFRGVTLNDLSRYSGFFDISETPKSIIDLENFITLYRNGIISREQYKEIKDSFELEEHFVRTLRKR